MIEHLGKPSATRRKELRADLQRILTAFWGYTERQFYNIRVKDESRRSGSRYEDRQSEKVLESVAAIRAWCDEVETEYR